MAWCVAVSRAYVCSLTLRMMHAQARTIQLPGELHACALFCAVIAAVMAVLIRVLVPVIRPCFLKRGAPYSQAEMEESIEIWTRVVVGATLCACFPVCPLRRTHKGIARVCAGRTTRHCMLGFVCTTAALNLAASMPAAANARLTTAVLAQAAVVFYFQSASRIELGSQYEGRMTKVVAANVCGVISYGVCGELAHALVFRWLLK